MIYFIRCGESVKIGHTTKSVQGRLKELQTGNPVELKLIGTVKGDRREEYRLHDLFCGLKVRGEWFRLSSELEEYINAVTGRVLFVKDYAPCSGVWGKLREFPGIFRFKQAKSEDRLKVAYELEHVALRARYQQ